MVADQKRIDVPYPSTVDSTCVRWRDLEKTTAAATGHWTFHPFTSYSPAFPDSLSRVGVIAVIVL